MPPARDDQLGKELLDIIGQALRDELPEGHASGEELFQALEEGVRSLPEDEQERVANAIATDADGAGAVALMYGRERAGSEEHAVATLGSGDAQSATGARARRPDVPLVLRFAPPIWGLAASFAMVLGTMAFIDGQTAVSGDVGRATPWQAESAEEPQPGPQRGDESRAATLAWIFGGVALALTPFVYIRIRHGRRQLP